MRAGTVLRSPVVVGRRPELDALERAVKEASSGRGACLFLLGEAGSGKTRLLLEARGEAQRAGMALFEASAPQVLSPAPYSVLAQALRSLTRRRATGAGDLGRFAAGLRQVLPEFPGPASPPDLTENQVRLLALEGALRLVLSAAAEAGAALLLDDLHAADPQTVEFVHHVAQVADEPVLLVATVRVPEGREVEAQARTLERAGHAGVLDLAPLDEDAVAALIERLLGCPPPPGLVVDVAERTDGIPLLVEVLVEAHLTSERLRLGDGRAIWSDAPAPVPSSSTLQILVLQRLDRLSDRGRAVVRAASALERCDEHLVAAVAPLSPHDAGPAIGEAVGAGLLEAGGHEVRFRHALVRDAVAQALLPAERRELHRRAAEAMARSDGKDPDRVEARAHHLAEAGLIDEAASLLVTLGRLRLTGHALVAAEKTFRSALSVGPAQDIADWAREGLAEVLGGLGRWQEALELDAAMQTPAADPALRALRMARNALHLQRIDETDRLLAEAVEAGAGPGPVATLSASIAMHRNDFAAAVRRAEEARQIGERDGDPEIVCGALEVLGTVAFNRGNRAEALEVFRKWADAADAGGLVTSRLEALTRLGLAQFHSGETPDALWSGRDVAKQVGAFAAQVDIDSYVGWFLGLKGRLREGLAIADEALDLARRFRLDNLPRALCIKAWTSLQVDHGRAEPILREALAVGAHDPDVLITAEGIRGEAAMRSGDVNAAAEHFGRSVDAIRAFRVGTPAAAPFMRSVCLIAAGRDAEARAALEETRDLSRTQTHEAWRALAQALLERSEDAAERALAPIAESAPLYRAVALVLAADLLRGPRTAGWLREALAVFQRAGAETDAARARQLLRAMGVPVPRAKKAARALSERLQSADVTRREAEVLDLVRQRLSNPEIAARLFVSVRTVESHVSSLLQKLGVESRTDLATIEI